RRDIEDPVRTLSLPVGHGTSFDQNSVLVKRTARSIFSGRADVRVPETAGFGVRTRLLGQLRRPP
ncbi:hypothetical protein, partial [Mycolicibacterium sp.]|uniref:hypothetical protein n=1 Tax=Mycolicibacterium sp. TaxID=2320850 RepID=UPI0037CA2E1C